MSIKAPTMVRREAHFDSLRGIAACLVAITHFLAAFYPYAVFGNTNSAQQHHAWETMALYPPLSLLSAGHFAVCLFFVLSGYVLSIRTIGEKGQIVRLMGAIAKRPFRLAGVLLFSLLCAGLLYEFNGYFNIPAAQASGSMWFAQFWTNDFSWVELLKEILQGKAGSEYNPPLWTLRIELVGSFIVFGLLLLINRLSYLVRSVVLVACLAYSYHTFYDGFLWGMLLADANKHFTLQQLSSRKAKAAAAIGLLFAALPYYALDASVTSTTPADSVIQQLYPHIPMLTAVIILLAVLRSRDLQRMLCRPLLVWLGSVSYALYAMHLLIIGSIAAYLHSQLAVKWDYGIASLLTFVVYISLLSLVSWLVTVAVDTPSVKLADRVDRFVRSVVTRIPFLDGRQA